MKKITRIIGTFLIMICLTGCVFNKKNTSNEEALAFKSDYESINGKTNASGLEHRTVSIPEDNPFVTITADELIEKIENKESFYVYFGDKQCPWCRSVIEKFIEVAKKNKVTKVYYVAIWDDDHNEILRDKYELNEKETKAKKVSDGSESYTTLLKYFDNVLADYTLTTSKGKEIKVGEKRIYAPNFINVKNGVAVNLVEGISDKQEDSREELTEEILNDEEKIFEEFFNYETCSKEGC